MSFSISAPFFSYNHTKRISVLGMNTVPPFRIPLCVVYIRTISNVCVHVLVAFSNLRFCLGSSQLNLPFVIFLNVERFFCKCAWQAHFPCLKRFDVTTPGSGRSIFFLISLFHFVSHLIAFHISIHISFNFTCHSRKSTESLLWFSPVQSAWIRGESCILWSTLLPINGLW